MVGLHKHDESCSKKDFASETLVQACLRYRLCPRLLLDYTKHACGINSAVAVSLLAEAVTSVSDHTFQYLSSLDKLAQVALPFAPRSPSRLSPPPIPPICSIVQLLASQQKPYEALLLASKFFAQDDQCTSDIDAVEGARLALSATSWINGSPAAQELMGTLTLFSVPQASGIRRSPVKKHANLPHITSQKLSLVDRSLLAQQRGPSQAFWLAIAHRVWMSCF